MRLTTRLLRSTSTSYRLRRKLELCGTCTADGVNRWCRTPACDRCRRYRARWIAVGAEEWAGGIIATHRMMQIECSTGAYADPGNVLDEVHRTRRAIRRSYHYRQQCDDRWGDIMQYACWMPCWDGSMWSAQMRGVIYLDRVAEVRFEDEVGLRHGMRIVSFPRAVIRADIRDHVYRAMTVMVGAKECADDEMSLMMSAIDYRGGYKPLLFRRGIQEKHEKTK